MSIACIAAKVFPIYGARKEAARRPKPLAQATHGFGPVGQALMEEALDDLDDFDDELEELSWSWRYVSVCLLIPTLNGFINGHCWAGLSLHYREMGWSIARVGTPSTFDFILRMVCQKIQAI